MHLPLFYFLFQLPPPPLFPNLNLLPLDSVTFACMPFIFWVSEYVIKYLIHAFLGISEHDL